jgi:hypothetical protein
MALLNSPRPEAVLVPRVDAVYPKLRALPAWREVYHDTTDAVFEPASPGARGE